VSVAGAPLRRLLVVYHSRTGGAEAMATAVAAGAGAEGIEGVEVVVRRAFDADVADVLAADAVVLGTPENFGYMSGALKDFLERIYHECLPVTRGRPYALFVKAGQDGAGAVTSVERILTGLAWRAVAEPLVVVGPPGPADLDRCSELGATVAAGLSLGMY
jgi:multimeric flavodoxin WrbA